MIMKTKRNVVLIFAILLPLIAFSQPQIHYLNFNPTIDGVADSGLPKFKITSFSKQVKSDESNPNVIGGYYLAFNHKYLYLFIETDADSITIRDRGYQNGDGFHLMIGKPNDNYSPTDEFYVLGFSPEKSWCNKMSWYYNVDLKMGRLSDNVLFESAQRNGKISFELLLPWNEVNPYNPLLLSKIGINLCFVKAASQNQKTLCYLKEDKRFQWEGSKREYEIADFKFDGIDSLKSWLTSGLENSTIIESQNLIVNIGGWFSSKKSELISTQIFSGENSIVMSVQSEVNFERDKSIAKISINGNNLYAGGYRVVVKLGNVVIGEHYLTVMPRTLVDDLKSSLKNIQSRLSNGSYNSIMFYINEIVEATSRLKSYETSFQIRNKIDEITHLIKEGEKGIDVLAVKSGVTRRAYLSSSDGTLYPYSIYLPEGYDKSKKYPLLVYLHGSGQDDRALFTTPIIPPNYIVLAPNGRGVSNCYVGDAAQNDIRNSIADVIQNFSIDSSKIVLSGFSMGGYGVYRTFYENQTLFKAIAVISGNPDLARKWVNKNELNFLDEKNLIGFKHIPVFIYHGKKDLSCPFSLTEEVVQKLLKIGTKVKFVVDESGHGSMPNPIKEEYYSWLKEQ